MTIEQVAGLCHELNRAYCHQLGDNSQQPWDDAPDWQRESAIAGVQCVLDGTYATPGDGHRCWLEYKLAEGWTYGTVKDPDKKEHPSMVPFELLPLHQQIKDHLFLAVVMACKPYVEV